MVGTSTLNSLASTLSGADRDNLQITITGGSVSFLQLGSISNRLRKLPGYNSRNDHIWNDYTESAINSLILVQLAVQSPCTQAPRWKI